MKPDKTQEKATPKKRHPVQLDDQHYEWLRDIAEAWGVKIGEAARTMIEREYQRS